MALLKIWQVSRAIMRLLVIQFVFWLGWFSTFALAQSDISEGVTGSLNNFPTLGITCVGNLAVLVTSLIRGRIDLEMGARDVLDILLSPKLHNIKRIKHGYALTTCIQGNAGNEGGDDLPTTSAEQVPQTVSREESDVHTASTEQVPQTASKEESDVHAASTRGTETASTEGNVNTSASTERGGLQTGSTAEIVIHIDSPEGQEAAAAAKATAAAAAEEAAAEKTEEGLKSAAVIMLSNDTANWSMKQFMKSNAYVVQSIVLPFLPLERALNDTEVKEELASGGVSIESCECRDPRCNCIVFWTMEEITHVLATRMPATLKLLSNSLCLLPCSTCLRKGCHECNRENLLRAESEADEGQRVVSDILDNIRAGFIRAGYPLGICIPMNDAHSDAWTKLLLKSLRSKDAEGRGVTNLATEALEGYLGGGRGSEEGSVEYDIFSFVVPRLTEVLINLVLTFWFRVDAFSSALLARRTVRDYLVDTKSSGFAANAFLTEAVVTVKSNGDNSQVCQVLTFRGRDWLCITTLISVGCVNVICALGWSLLISFEGGPDTSQPPSLPTVALIIAAIGSPWMVLMLASTVAFWEKCWLTFLRMLVLIHKTLRRFVRFLDTDTDRSSDTYRFLYAIGIYRFLDTISIDRFLDTIRIDRRPVWQQVVFPVIAFPVCVIVFVAIVLCVSVIVFGFVFSVSVIVFAIVYSVAGFVFCVSVIVSVILVLLVIQPVMRAWILLVDMLKMHRNPGYAYPLIATGLLFEMACFVSWSALAGALGIKGFGRWLYGALQILIWVKWASGSCFLNLQNSSEFFGRIPDRWALLLYSSAFWLNAVLAGVRCKWDPWPWQHNHLFSFVSP